MNPEYRRARAIADAAKFSMLLELWKSTIKLDPKAKTTIFELIDNIEQQPLAYNTARAAVEKAVEEIRTKSI